MVLTLEIVDPPADLQEESHQTFDEEGGTIGRRAGNHWRLPDSLVSGQHATISFQYGAFSIIDTSTNGVFVDGARNRLELGRSHRLRSGDVIGIGPYVIRVSVTPTADDEDATIIAPQTAVRSARTSQSETTVPRILVSRTHASDASDQRTTLPPEGTFVKTLVITDLVASTRMTEEVGDSRASEIFSSQDRLARDLLAQHNGVEVDKTDGFLLFFDRPIEAVHFSLAYHQALDELSKEVGFQIATRIGIHLGEVIVRKNTDEDIARGANEVEVEGFAKPFTARLMALAVGKQTLLSHSVFDVARRASVGVKSEHGELRWVAHGSYVMKGVEDPVDVFEVGVEGIGPLTAPPGGEKAKRAPTKGTL